MNTRILTLLAVLATPICLLAQYDIEPIDTSRYIKGEGVDLSRTSFRGLSVVNNKTFWLSGSRGTVGKSTNGGKTVLVRQIPYYDRSDFRDVAAFSDKHAVVMASGTPALMLVTLDGGYTWKETFHDARPEIFLDAMDFWDDKNGIAVGDPVNGHFVLLTTSDGGMHWKMLDPAVCPPAHDSEAVFAASGTALRCWGNKEFGFVTGGSVSRFISAKLVGDSAAGQQSYGIPLTIGKPSRGAFSFCTMNGNVLAVGGDYAADTLVTHNSAVLMIDKDAPPCVAFNGFIARDPKTDVKGYRSCVELLKNGTVFIACGTSGVDIGSLDFKKETSQGYHVVQKAKKGKAVYLAGGRGRIARLNY